MAGKGKESKADEEMMLGAWNWAGEAAATYGLGVRVTLAPTVRKGIFLVKAQALHMADGKPIGVSVQVTREWPSASQQTIAGCIMNVLMQLDHTLGIDALDTSSP